jgi:hypothetical protein
VNYDIKHTSEVTFLANRNGIIKHCIIPDSENGYKTQLRKNTAIGCGRHTCRTTTRGGVLPFEMVLPLRYEKTPQPW